MADLFNDLLIRHDLHQDILDDVQIIYNFG